MEARSDWQWLPQDLLYSIIKKLNTVSDYLRFSAVCKYWHSVAADRNLRKLRIETCYKEPPKLMIPAKGCSTKRRGLYDVCQGKILSLTLPVPLNRRCCGSSHGWLAFAMEDLSIILFNPSSGRKIDLPSLNVKAYYKPQYFVSKVVLSANPSQDPDNFAAAAIYGDMNRLAYIKAGQKTWRKIPAKFRSREFELVASDVIFHQGLIYAVSYYSQIISTNITTKERRKLTKQTKHPCHLAYLVESSRAELFMVKRFLTFSPNKGVDNTSKFEVYKIARSGQNEFVQELVNDLQGDSFFLGDNHSISVVASEFKGCRPNCLYFTDDYAEFFYPMGPRDMGIYNLKDASFEMHYVPNPILHKKLPPPIWITPTPNWD